ncbi:hypothetical protein LJB42_004606 [Komagataella kurtzmanii]|nr:hypothetical protein LJB42_004606 [Komagataella kurtzmanii]
MVYQYSVSPDAGAGCLSALSYLLHGRFSRKSRATEENEKLLEYYDNDSDDSLQDVKTEKLSTGYWAIDSKVDTTERLRALRFEMKRLNIGVYIVPSEDQHQSEYTSEKDMRRGFISGFDGSSGVAVVSLTGEAVLSTDGRYFLQAERQLDSNWKLLKLNTNGYITWQDWCLQQALALDVNYRRISVDPRLITRKLGEWFLDKCHDLNIQFEPTNDNLVDRIWTDRPRLNTSNIFPLDQRYTGESSEDKIQRIRQQLKTKNASALFVTALDDIAWILNLRGSGDIPFNPVFISYLVVLENSLCLYIPKISSLTPPVSDHLKDLGCRVQPYGSFWDDLQLLESGFAVVVPSNCSFALASNIPPTVSEVIFESMVTNMKCIKNPVELKNHKMAQWKDGIALVRFFAWLEEYLLHHKLTEYQSTQVLSKYRSEMANFRGESFATIASTGSNASIIHYAPTETESKVIDRSEVFLCDSGAHYLEGTTDITRTLHFGNPSAELKERYTLVLKGHIQLALSHFPKGTDGKTLDAIARQPLWRYGLDYHHGTSHGIGSYLCVHEGPVGIGTLVGNETPLQPGNFISNEPGFYKDGEYGFRIESDMAVVDSNYTNLNDDPFFKFDYYTRVPFCRKLIDEDLLNIEERRWLTRYHEVLRNELGGVLIDDFDDRRAWEYLCKETKGFEE